MIRVAPSILSADFLYLAQEVEQMKMAGADMIHVDVMDGHFVPNLTMGPLVVRALKRVATIPIDVHLMIERPEQYIAAFAEAGADRLTIHVEACTHLQRALAHIRSLGLLAGAALNPSTPVETLSYVADDLDMVLVMSVNPGFSNQKFIPVMRKKIADVRALLDNAGRKDCEVAVDGGITEHTIGPCFQAGATCFIAGAAIFDSKDYAKAIESLRRAACGKVS